MFPLRVTARLTSNGKYVHAKWKSKVFACFWRETQNAWEWERSSHFQYDGSRMKDCVRFCASSFHILWCWRPQTGRIAPTTQQAQENEIWRRLHLRQKRHSSLINSFVLATPWAFWNQISQRMSKRKKFICEGAWKVSLVLSLIWLPSRILKCVWLTTSCINNTFIQSTSVVNYVQKFIFVNLIFVVPSIMLYSSEISPTRCNNCVFILRNGFTLHVSGDNLTHHQEYICCIWPQVSRLT